MKTWIKAIFIIVLTLLAVVWVISFFTQLPTIVCSLIILGFLIIVDLFCLELDVVFVLIRFMVLQQLSGPPALPQHKQ